MQRVTSYAVNWSDRNEVTAAALGFIELIRGEGEGFDQEALSIDEQVAYKSALRLLDDQFKAGPLKDRIIPAVVEEFEEGDIELDDSCEAEVYEADSAEVSEE